MNDPAPRAEPLALALQGIDKRYGSTRALSAASLHVRAHTVHALLGENGAGKSTLMRIAYGLERPDAGTVTVRGANVRFGGPADAIARGIGMVHQHFTLVPTMTVAENVALGGQGLLDLTRVTQALRALSRQMGVVLDPAAPVETLSVAAQQRVEIAKALVREARLLVLDEPTAVLPPTESAELLRWLRSYADQGHAVVLITHKLHEAMSIADDVTVLRHGRTVMTAPRGDADVTSLTAAMIGLPGGTLPERTAVTSPHGDAATAGAPVFRAERVTLTDSRGVTRLHRASFVIHAGEIVGIAGVEGAGQRELLRAMAGRLPITSGVLDRPAVVGFVPEDRHRDAVLLDRPLVENVVLRGAGRRRGVIDWKAAVMRTSALMQAFDVRADGARAPMRTLSGGNQQKLVLARELEASGDPGPRAIVVENPTRGLDVRATADVHAQLREARDAGATVVVYSSDIDEVFLLASRILVVFEGVVHEAPPDRAVVGRMMLGVDVHAAR